MDERGATSLCDLLAAAKGGPGALSGLGGPPSLHLIVLRGRTPGEMITLEPGARAFGRAPENGVQLADMSVSRQHATLLVDADGLAWLTDLGSTNGTFLNGERLAAHHPVGLRDGDRIGLGPQHLFKFVQSDALDARHHREMFERTVRDPLTGLYHRAYFLTQMSEVVEQTYRRGLGLAVVMLDIDHFKRVNDTHGHAAGDRVLVHVSTVLRQSTRPTDLVARYGGEEFVAALPIASLEQAWERSEAMRRSLKKHPTTVPGGRLTITASFGVTFGSSARPLTIDRLLKGADQALYQAKALGRDRVVLDDAFNGLGAKSGSTEEFPTSWLSGTSNGLTTVDVDAYRDPTP